MSDNTQVKRFQIEDLSVTDAKVAEDAAIEQSKIENLPTDLDSKLNRSGGSMTGYLTMAADPVDDLEIATKQYVDQKLGILGAGTDLLITTTGLKMTWVSNSTISVSSGATLDSTESGLIFLPSAVRVNINAVGVNGRDTEDPIVQNTFYYLYLIANSNSIYPTKCILSRNFPSPVMPSGYDRLKMIGFIRITGPDSGTAIVRSTYPQAHGSIKKFDYIGKGSLRKLIWEDMIIVKQASGPINTWFTYSGWASAFPLGITRNAIVNFAWYSGNPEGVFTCEYHIREPISAASAFSSNPTGGEITFMKTCAYRANANGGCNGEITCDNNGNLEFYLKGNIATSIVCPYFKGHCFEI